VQNKDSQPMPYGFALHPYFNLLPERAKTLVTLPARRVMEADSDLLPTGRMLDVSSTMYQMFNLSQPTPVHQLRLDHVYTDLPAKSASVIAYPGLDLRLNITTSEDFTHTVIYTPADEPYFCLENQTCSTDAINLANQGQQEIAHLLEVQPGETATGYIHYAVEYL
jgi:aldose 1-epimerase